MDAKKLLDRRNSKEERVQAAFHLAGRRDKSSLQSLLQALLTDPSPVVRHECAFILGETKLSYVGEFLMKAVENDASPLVKHEALSSLGSLGDPSYILFIQGYLDHPDEIIRESAEIAVERITRYQGGKCFV